MTPYYQDSAVTLYHGDCREIVPQLGRFDLLLTDPPYGIKKDEGIGGRGVDGFGGRYPRTHRGRYPRTHRKYAGGWDSTRPDAELLALVVAAADAHIIWGGNYFSDLLPVQSKWLVWDKEQTMPTYSDAELAWTTLSGVAVKMFRYCGSGLMAVEKERWHPTQKPLALIAWCLSKAPEAKTVLDPFAGSGTTGRACKDRGIKCTLIEREESYCEIAARRCQQEVLNFAQ